MMSDLGVPPAARVLGVALDGVGDDADGCGAEFLLCSRKSSVRLAQLRQVPLPEHDARVREWPYRLALAHLWAAGIPWDRDLPPVRASSAEEREVLARQFDRGVGCVGTTSMRRLFGAVSSLLGVCQVSTYDGQAAVELQRAAASARDRRARDRVHRFAVGVHELDPAPLLEALVASLRAGVDPRVLARRFHRAVADAVVEVVLGLRAATGVGWVVLSGALFGNELLASMVVASLAANGLTVLAHGFSVDGRGDPAPGQPAVALSSAELG